MSAFNELQIKRALNRLIESARSVAYIDQVRMVGAEDHFRKMQALSIMLSELKQSVAEYDETLAFFEEEEAE